MNAALITLGTIAAIVLLIYFVGLYILWPKGGGMFDSISKAVAVWWPIIAIAWVFMSAKNAAEKRGWLTRRRPQDR